MIRAPKVDARLRNTLAVLARGSSQLLRGGGGSRGACHGVLSRGLCSHSQQLGWGLGRRQWSSIHEAASEKVYRRTAKHGQCYCVGLDFVAYSPLFGLRPDFEVKERGERFERRGRFKTCGDVFACVPWCRRTLKPVQIYQKAASTPPQQHSSSYKLDA